MDDFSTYLLHDIDIRCKKFLSHKGKDDKQIWKAEAVMGFFQLVHVILEMPLEDDLEDCNTAQSCMLWRFKYQLHAVFVNKILPHQKQFDG
ncbi:hypothetical protein H5410_035612 [Solanum commersonii]|uniref:Uncharacterized protein n=1 Tax=Solanum commersonii TaxID=4109 RepID=A0A9J5Y573_SOLCO|nr:hypothetical protein H5410_035612 [Solanum commersonii]